MGPRSRRKLQQHHIEYLCCQNTLREWAHLSLIQRARMFHRVFPELKVSATHLARTYSQQGIRFKFIQRGKKTIDYSNQYYLNLFRDMHTAVRRARLRDLKLVWVDEAVFTFNTFSTKAWAGRYSSIQVKDTELRLRTVALVAAISEDGGLEAYALHPRSISTAEFVAFVKQLSQRFGEAEFAMFMDNLQVHKTKEVLEACKEAKVNQIFNVPYSPDFNGIECYFSLVKAQYKKLMLQQILKGIRPDSYQLVRESLAHVEKEKAQRCVGLGLKYINLKA